MEYGNYPVYHVTLVKEGRIMAEATTTTAKTEKEAVAQVHKHYGYQEKHEAKIIRLQPT